MEPSNLNDYSFLDAKLLPFTIYLCANGCGAVWDILFFFLFTLSFSFLLFLDVAVDTWIFGFSSSCLSLLLIYFCSNLSVDFLLVLIYTTFSQLDGFFSLANDIWVGFRFHGTFCNLLCLFVSVLSMVLNPLLFLFPPQLFVSPFSLLFSHSIRYTKTSIVPCSWISLFLRCLVAESRFGKPRRRETDIGKEEKKERKRGEQNKTKQWVYRWSFMIFRQEMGSPKDYVWYKDRKLSILWYFFTLQKRVIEWKELRSRDEDLISMVKCTELAEWTKRMISDSEREYWCPIESCQSYSMTVRWKTQSKRKWGTSGEGIWIEDYDTSRVHPR